MVLHNHECGKVGHGYHDYEENIMMVLIIPYISLPQMVIMISVSIPCLLKTDYKDVEL